MPTIIEVNVQTGEQTEREMTEQEIAQLVPAPQIPVADPVQKLQAFLSANPDVAALLT